MSDHSVLTHSAFCRIEMFRADRGGSRTGHLGPDLYPSAKRDRPGHGILGLLRGTIDSASTF